jgi:hypothetical protein
MCVPPSLTAERVGVGGGELADAGEEVVEDQELVVGVGGQQVAGLADEAAEDCPTVTSRSPPPSAAGDHHRDSNGRRRGPPAPSAAEPAVSARWLLAGAAAFAGAVR